jgi:hypothetical protein
MVDNLFQPASITVPAGATVTWINRGQIIHTATADNGSFDSGIVNPGGSYSARFSQPGTISYKCIIHPDTMRGTIVVQAAAPPPAQAATAAPPAPTAQSVAPASAPALTQSPAQGVAAPPVARTPAGTARSGAGTAEPVALPTIGNGGAAAADSRPGFAAILVALAALLSGTALRQRRR